MDPMMILRAFAAVLTVLAAALVAANLSPRTMVWGFSNFYPCIDCLDRGRLAGGKASLVIQNVVLLLINILGVWRWLPKAEKKPAIDAPPHRHPQS